MADRRTVTVAARVTPAKHAAWQDKAAAAGVSPSVLLRQAMARTRTWTAPALAIERQRARQIARIGNNLNQLARWANTDTTAAEAVAVVAHLVSFELSLLAVARFNGDGGDAH
ncbi:MobC family plasmid mobilization relaxosome protein [Candidatus Palauibacter sp.]|uniref:MobC family plasmid mobilization relaxosome protein n=1 Tax=Candidatus Palauibacter sp. TaxID=3101350 RepID=UPI003B5C09AB